MAKIISFGNMKGGVGKTTCSVLLATTLSQAPFNNRVIVIDLDKQKSIVKSRLYDIEDYSSALPFEIANYNLATFEQKIRELDKEYDLILIDTGGKLDNNIEVMEQEIARVLFYTDFLFIPFTSGNYTLEASLEFLKFARLIKAKREKSARKMQLYGFINKYKERSKARRHLTTEIEEIKAIAPIQFLRNNLKDYSLFGEVDTVENLYNSQSSDRAVINLVLWINEIEKIINE